MRIGKSLFLLVGAATVPLIAFSVFMGYSTVEQAADDVRQAALDRTRTLMTAVDAELRGHVASLQALSTSESLALDRFDAFRREAQRALATQRVWQNVILTDVQGRTLVNALTAAPEELSVSDERSALQALRTGRPVVGNVAFRDPPGAYGIGIRLPILRDGEPKYLLSAIISPQVFQDLIAAQRLPANWVSGLVDSEQRFVARVPPRPHSDSASPAFREQIAKAPEGWYRGLTVDNTDTYTAFKRSEETGWSIGLAMPATQYRATGIRAATILAGGILLTLVVGWAVAFILARYITFPAKTLAEAAKALGTQQGTAPPLDRIHIDELRDVAKALDEASSGLAERDRLLHREQDALRAADRAKNEFLAMLGHELRNPLAAIATSSEVLKRNPAAAKEGFDPLATIARQTRQMTRLVEDLLDASRLNMGKMSLSLELFDLGEAVRQTAQSWEGARAARTGRLLLSLHPAWVKADRLRTEQIVVNLLDNAEKFSQADTSIFLAVEADNAWVRLIVRDAGRGIAPQSIEKIFDLFVQDTQSPEYAGQGLGIGLALVKGLAELHGGKAEAASEGLGKGATFTISLPRQPAPEQRASRSPEQAGPVTPLRILIVEDNDDSRRAMEELLILEGHDVRSAPNGAGALALMDKFSPGVALVDIGLPDMSGYEVAKGLRRHFGPSLLIISLSGYGQTEDQQRAIAAGIDFYLTKPVELPHLRELMGRA